MDQKTAQFLIDNRVSILDWQRLIILIDGNKQGILIKNPKEIGLHSGNFARLIRKCLNCNLILKVDKKYRINPKYYTSPNTPEKLKKKLIETYDSFNPF